MCVAAWKSLPATTAIGFFTTHPQMRRSRWVFPKGERGRHRAPSGRDVSSWMLLKDQLRENRDLYLDSHGVFVRKLQGYKHAASNGSENELALGDYFFFRVTCTGSPRPTAGTSNSCGRYPLAFTFSFNSPI